MTLTMDEIAAEAGRVMDDHCPGWYKMINFETLEMFKDDKCVAGQCGLKWMELAEELYVRLGLKNPAKILPDINKIPPNFQSMFASEGAVPYWRKEVKARFAREVKTRLARDSQASTGRVLVAVDESACEEARLTHSVA